MSTEQVAGTGLLSRSGEEGPGRAGSLWPARVLLLLVLLAVGIAGSGGPTPDAAYDPSSTGPSGLRGVVDLLRELDVRVDVGTADDASADTVLVLPGVAPDVVEVLPGDGRRIVSTTPPPEVDTLTEYGFGGLGLLTLPVDCPLLPDVTTLAAAAWVGWIAPEGEPEPAPGDRCVAVDDGWWLVRTTEGGGEHLHLTSLDPLLNARLDDTADAAVAVARLLAPAGNERVLVLDVATTAPPTLADLVPLRVAHALLLGVLAVLLLAAARGRRLGAPPDEQLPVRVPGGELVRALGDLRTRAGHTGASHAALRQHTMEVLRRTHRLAPDADADEVLAAHRAAGLEVPSSAVTAFGTTEPPDDATLTRVAATLAALRASVAPSDDGPVATAAGPSTTPATPPTGTTRAATTQAATTPTSGAAGDPDQRSPS